MIAIIKTGGKQYKVSEGEEIFVEKLTGDAGSKVTFDTVVFVDGKIGTPTVAGASVTGTIEKQGKGKKLKVARYHAKSNVFKLKGHRQPYTKVKIESIKAA